jgi:ubiquitin C-terminal hydrolase
MATQRVKAARGLVNVGNTCYLNSVVQSLNTFPLFHNYIQSLKEHGLSNGLLNKLSDTLAELKNVGATAFRPTLVMDESLRKHFKPGEQQDAHEFLTFLLDEIVSGGSGTSGSTPVTDARASGLASGLALLLAPEAKEKPRRVIATTRSHMDAALYSSLGHISLTQSTVLGPPSVSNIAAPGMALKRGLNQSLSAKEVANLSKSTTSAPSVPHNLSSSLSFPTPLVPFSDLSGLSGSTFMNSPMTLVQAVQKSKKTVPASPFMGKMQSTIHCSSCGSTWSMIQPMTMLSAYIPPTPDPTLLDCIVSFRKSEDVRDVHCQRCARPRRVQKRLSVAKAPEILCIFINRLKYEKIGGSLAPKKLDAHVKFDFDFDLATATSQLSLYVAEAEDRVDDILSHNIDSISALSGHTPAHSQSSTAASPSPRNHFNGRDSPSEASSVASYRSTSEFRESKRQDLNVSDIPTNSFEFSYSLLAVIVHIGNSSGGHYIMFKAPKRNPKTNNWLQISDSDVREVPPSHVLRQHAYMLFYQKDSSLPLDEEDLHDTVRGFSSPLTQSPSLADISSRCEKANGHQNGFHSPEETRLPNGHVHEPAPLGSSSTNLSSSSFSSSSLPTSSPDPEENHKSRVFLEPEESPEPELNDPLRSAQGLPMEILQRPLQELGDPHEGFNAILASRAES